MMMNDGQILNPIATKIIHLIESHCKSPRHLHQIQAQLILHNLHPDSAAASTFIAACSRLGTLHSAFLLYTAAVFCPHRFVCNQLLRALSHSKSLRHHHNALFLYSHMLKSAVPFNNYTFPFVLKSLSELRSLRQGECVHAHVIRLGHVRDVYVGNSLLNLYASCGDMQLCNKMFDEMPLRDVVSWTVMITGYRGTGEFGNALIAFGRMQSNGIEPNRVTMVNALAACASTGVLDTGLWIDEFIQRKGWRLDVVLGTALLDMYAKCGKLQEGLSVFKRIEQKEVIAWSVLIKGFALAKCGEEAVWWFSKMQEEGFRPNEVTLLAVLSACVHSGLISIGKEIFSSLLNEKYGFPPNVKHFSCMVDLLSRNGRLEDALKMIQEMPFQATKSMWGAFLGGCRAHGNLELSELAARKLVEMEPDNGAYCAVLSDLYKEMGRWDDAARVRGLMEKMEVVKKEHGHSSCADTEFHDDDDDDDDVSKWLIIRKSESECCSY